MKRRALLGLVGWVLLSFTAALIGSAFPPGAWFEALEKPGWQPPNWVFGPVWTVLYALMGGAAWLVWRERGSFTAARGPLLLFLVQLALNAAWSPAFFGAQDPGLALVVIAALWLALLATLIAFWRVRALAGVLLLPYHAWVSFATALNFALWRLNA
jgi:translocator protein